MRTAQTKVLSLDFHRNGISGQGFYVALVESKEDGETRTMVVVRFVGADAKGNPSGPAIDKTVGAVVCAAFDVAKLAKGDIEFGSNSWRGDHYHDVVDKAIKERG